jgi:hypothetical protein
MAGWPGEVQLGEVSPAGKLIGTRMFAERYAYPSRQLRYIE